MGDNRCDNGHCFKRGVYRVARRRAYSLRLLYAARRGGLKFRGEVVLHLFYF